MQSIPLNLTCRACLAIVPPPERVLKLSSWLYHRPNAVNVGLDVITSACVCSWHRHGCLGRRVSLLCVGQGLQGKCCPLLCDSMPCPAACLENCKAIQSNQAVRLKTNICLECFDHVCICKGENPVRVS